MTDRVWIVVQVKSADGRTFEIGGVYTSEERALAACTEPTDATFALDLDTDYGRETTLVPVYPPEHAAAIRAMGTTGRRAELTEHGVEHLDLKGDAG